MNAEKKLTKEQMVAEILIVMKANGVTTTGDMFFALAFRTDSELRKICRELHIRT